MASPLAASFGLLLPSFTPPNIWCFCTKPRQGTAVIAYLFVPCIPCADVGAYAWIKESNFMAPHFEKVCPRAVPSVETPTDTIWSLVSSVC